MERHQYSRWKTAVNKRLIAIYGITIVDSGVDDSYLTVHWEMKQSPFEFVEWLESSTIWIRIVVSLGLDTHD